MFSFFKKRMPKTNIPAELNIEKNLEWPNMKSHF